MKDITYSYADGNGNQYLITSHSVENIPVTKENSSSGIYSGGNPAKTEISAEEFDEIEKAIKVVLKNKSIHIQNRQMDSGMIVVKKNKKEETVYFKRSEEMKALESVLNKIIAKE